MEIITGEMDGEKIVRAETVWDKVDKLVEKQLDELVEGGSDCGEIVGDRVGEINGVDSDEYRDNEEDR
jgi:hypothetical protein